MNGDYMPPKTKPKKSKFRKAADVVRAIGFCLFLTSCIFSYPIAYRSSEVTLTITIADKESITIRSGENISSKYIVFSEEGEVFENTDSILYLKFSSSDVQGSLKIGKEYDIKVAGWRIPFFSAYRNIISAK